jgi:hypothetical protein
VNVALDLRDHNFIYKQLQNKFIENCKRIKNISNMNSEYIYVWDYFIVAVKIINLILINLLINILFICKIKT